MRYIPRRMSASSKRFHATQWYRCVYVGDYVVRLMSSTKHRGHPAWSCRFFINTVRQPNLVVISESVLIQDWEKISGLR
jgi:hypothetical protein